MRNKYSYLFLILLFSIVSPDTIAGQDKTQTESTKKTDETPVPEQVDVKPAAEDSEIQRRLSGILAATGWFSDTEVEVNDDVVFIRGTTVSMPGEEREMLFPQGVPVQLDKEDKSKSTKQESKEADQPDDSTIATGAEGQLQSNDEEIREQARRSRSPEEGENLLRSE